MIAKDAYFWNEFYRIFVTREKRERCVSQKYIFSPMRTTCYEQYTNIDYLIMLVCAVIKNLNARAKEHTRTEKTRNENLGLVFPSKKKKKEEKYKLISILEYLQSVN